jgi:RimJ/RimL family protein N-acetyltransferase
MDAIDYSGYFWQDGLVRLRAMHEEDWEKHYLNRFDSAARRLLQYEIELPPTVNGEKSATTRFVDFAPGTGRLMFVIETHEGRAVGALNLNSIDERNGTFSIGMQVNRDQRGKGYGTSAMRILLGYAFHERRLNKYNGAVLEGNIASSRMLKKLGCREEGERRETVYSEGRYQNEILFGLTRRDFERDQKQREAGKVSK